MYNMNNNINNNNNIIRNNDIDNNNDRRVFGTILTENDTNIRSPQRLLQESYKLSSSSPVKKFLQSSSSSSSSSLLLSNVSIIEKNDNNLNLSSSLSPMRRLPLHNHNHHHQQQHHLIESSKIQSKVQQSSPQYSITFPPGPMGLELEPVIISSEREIGCRVKDYYFGVDHDGINEDYALKNIAIGDIISCISGKVVLSSKFTDILDILRSLKGTSRTIIFKNISASWNSSNKTENNYVFSSNKLTKPILSSSVLSTDRNHLKPTISASPLMRSPLVTKNNNTSYDRDGDISISFTKDHHSFSNLLVSPKAVREISKSSNSSAVQSPIQRSVQSSALHNLKDSTTIPIISVDLKRVLGTIGSSIGASILTIGNALGNVIGEHAERVVVNTAEKIPRYNMNEMDQVVMKKQKLLNELSESCFLLGAAEESKQSLLSQVDDLKSKEMDLSAKLTSVLEKLTLLENENINLKLEKTETLLSLQNTQSELDFVKSEFNVISQSQVKMSLELLELNKNASIQQQNLVDITEDLNLKEIELQKALSNLEGEVNARNVEQKTWQNDMERILVEKQNLRRELEATFDKVKSQLEDAENARDTALVELEVLRDTAKSDRDAFEVDQLRMRENLRLQQEQYKEQLLEKEGDIYAQRKEISDLKLELVELKKFKADAELFRVDMSNKVSDTLCEVAAKDQQLRELELKIQTETPKKKKMNEDMDCLRENLLSLADRSAQLENHVQLLEQKNGILEGEIDSLNYIITESKEENLKLMALMDSMETKASTTAAELQLSKDKVSILEDKNQSNIETSKRLTIENQGLEQQIVKLTNQIELITEQWKEQLQISSVFEEKLQDSQEYICQLKDSKTNLLKEIDDEQRKFKELEDEHDAYKNHMGVLERRLEERNFSIVELNSKLDDACQQYQECMNHLDVLMKEKNSSDISLQNLLKERDLYKSEAVSVKEMLQSANAKHSLIEVDFLKAIAMAEETHDGVEKDLEMKIAKLEIDRDTYKKQSEEHAYEIDRLTTYNNDTQAFAESELSKAESDLQQAAIVMDDMKLTISKQEQIIKGEIDRSSELNKSLDASKEQLAILNEKLACSSESYNLAVASKTQIESDMKDLYKKIDSLEAEKSDILDNCSKKCLWFFECTGNLRTDLAEARIDISNLMDLNSQMSKVAIDSLAKSSSKVNDLTHKIKILTNQKEDALFKLQVAENNANDAHERYNHSISKILDIEKSKDGAVNEIASLHKQLNDSLQSSTKIQEKLQISEQKSLTIIQDFNNETSKLKDHYEQRIKSLEEDLAHLNDSLAAKDKQCEEVQMLKKIDNDNYVKETASYKDHMSSLTKQLVELTIKNEDLELRVTEASSVINEQLELLKVTEEAYNSKQRELTLIQQAQDSTTDANHHHQQLIVDLEHSILSYKEDVIHKDSIIHSITEKYNKLIADLEQSKNTEGMLRTQIADQDAIIISIKKENELKFDSLVQQSDEILKSNMKEIESLKCLMQESVANSNKSNGTHILKLKEQLNDSQQNNSYLKTQLDDMLIALDAQALAVKEAEIREYEHNSTIKYLERLVLEAGIIAKNSNSNTNVNVTNEQNSEYTLRLLNQIKEVQSNLSLLKNDYSKKCEDYDTLNAQVIQLLRTSYTPMKPPSTDNNKNENPKGTVLFNDDIDYKKIQSSNSQRVPLGDMTQQNNSNNDYDEISSNDEDDMLVTIVLQLHDLIGSAVMFVSNSSQEDNADLKSKTLSKWYLVSDKVQELYQAILKSNEDNVPTLPCLRQHISSMIMDNETSTYDDSNIDDSLEGAFANNENLSPINEISSTTNRCRCPVGQQLDKQDQYNFHVINEGDQYEKDMCVRNSFQSIVSCSTIENNNNNVYNRHNNIEDDDTVRLSSNFFVENEIRDNIDGDSQPPEGEESFWNVSTETDQSSSFCANIY